MARIRKTVRQLAGDNGIDEDEALIALWDVGDKHFEAIMGPNDVIPYRDLKRAKRALGVATRCELKTVTYWRSLLDLNEKGFAALLANLGISVRKDATVLPPKAFNCLKAEARRQGIDPMKGGGTVTTTTTPKSKSKEIRPTKRAASKAQTKAETFEWRVPHGYDRPLRWLTNEEVIGVHEILVRDFARSENPIDPPGVRSDDLLGSAVFRPQTALGGTLKYSTVESSAAALLHSIVQDHPFHNGNKRTALVSMLVFLDENGLVPTCDHDECFKLVLDVAQHRIETERLDNLADREVVKIAEWIHRGTRRMERGNRQIPWRKLKRILIAYGCKTETIPGNRINITRSVSKKALFRKPTQQTVRTQVFYADDGREAKTNTIRKIRKELELDNEHGIDAYDFYGKDPTKAEDFIVKYRKTLQRLAKI